MPFNVEQFLDIFRSYNEAVFPAQIVLITLAVAAVIAASRGGGRSGKVVAAVLAVLWLWTGGVYHLLFFTRINNAAYTFAALCVVQAVVFFYIGVVRGDLTFCTKPDRYGITGGLFIAYALVVYPLLGYVFGHAYPASPTFGAPCPATIFTFGILLLSEHRLPVYVYAIPFVWSLIGGSAAVLLGVPEDLGLLAAGLTGSVLLYLKK